MTVNLEKTAGTVELGSAFGVGYTVPRVNLLPPEIAEERRLRRTQGVLALAFVGVLGAVAGGYLLAAASAAQAEDELAAEQATTTVLQAEQAEYAEVPRVLAQVESAQNARSTAMASDVLWYRYLNDLALTYPENVWLKDMNATVAASPAALPAVAGATTTQPGIGTLTFTGNSLQHSDVAAWLDVLAGTEGFQDATFTNSTRTQIDETDVVEFTSQVNLGADALSHRYDREAG